MANIVKIATNVDKRYFEAKVGEKGRVYLPSGLIQKYQIEEGDRLHFFANGNIEIRAKTDGEGNFIRFESTTNP